MPTTEIRRIELGRAAVRAGDIDGNYEDKSDGGRTGYVDTLANILHAARADGVDFWSALDSAAMHYEAEVADANGC